MRRPERRPGGVWKVSLRWLSIYDPDDSFSADCRDLRLDSYIYVGDPVQVLCGAHEGVQGTAKKVLYHDHDPTEVVLQELPGIKFKVRKLCSRYKYTTYKTGTRVKELCLLA
jgi:hypothetical protein